MLQKDVSGPHPATSEQILACLESSWTKAGEEHEESQWPADQRAARRLWAGLGFLAFGRLDHLEETLKIILANPRAATSKASRYYVSALQKLLPLPEGLSPAKQPADALRWWSSVCHRLVWSEEAGRFVEAPHTVAALPALAGPTQATSEAHSSSRLPFIVVDYDVWGNVSVMDEIFSRCRTERLGVLVPDVALYKLGKSAGNYDHCKTLLQHFAKERAIVSVAKGVGEMMRAECHLGQPTRNLVDEFFTQAFRQVLHDLEAGGRKNADAFLTRLSEDVRAELPKREHPEINRHVITSIRSQWQETLSAGDLAKLRVQDESVFVRIMAEWETTATVFQAAKREGCTDEAAMQLTLEPSVYGHLIYGLAALALDSLAAEESGAEGSTQEWRDLSDLDYLCIALFCTDLSTNSTRSRRIYSRLLKALQVRDEVIKALVKAEREMPGRGGVRFNRVGLSNLTKRMRKPRIKVSRGV